MLAQVRAQRPNREMTNDLVQLSLIKQSARLQEIVNRLQAGAKRVAASTATLEATRGALASDAADKARLHRLAPEAPLLRLHLVFRAQGTLENLESLAN